MANAIKFNNAMQEVAFTKFNAVEMDIFFAICSQMKDQGLTKITFTFEQLRSLSDYPKTANAPFITDLTRVYKKLLSLVYKVEDSSGDIEYFVLFTNFKVSPKNQTVIIQLNEQFEFILNQLNANFTRFELDAFTSLKSSYAKTMYRLLKQWKTVGKKGWNIDDFRTLLDIPKSYRISEIDKKVLKPIFEELPKHFTGLTIKKIKQGRGGKVVGLEFTWQAETKADRRKKTSRKKFRQETLPDWAEAEIPPKPTLIALENYTNLSEQMTRLGQSIESYDLIEERYQTELHEWLKKWGES